MNKRTQFFRTLRLEMANTFSLDELRSLSFDTAVAWEELSGETISSKVQSLIEMAARYGWLSRLIDLLRQERPHVNWPDIPEATELPFHLGTLDFVANEAERRAAWALYVELATRIATRPFDEDRGLMRNVLSSLYTIFGLTRQILREAGPDVAHGPNSFGVLAVEVLNKGISPFTMWHQPLAEYEKNCLEDVDALTYEKAWAHYETMKADLLKLQKQMEIYAHVLAEIAGAEVA